MKILKKEIDRQKEENKSVFSMNRFEDYASYFINFPRKHQYYPIMNGLD